MRLSPSKVRVRQRAAVTCCIALALGCGLGLGLIVREAQRPPVAHSGKPERELLVEIERIHASACNELRGFPVGRRASTAEPILMAHIHDLRKSARADLGSLEAEAIRFTHSLDRVAAGTTSDSQRDDRVAELGAHRDALEGEVQALMSTERATLRAERADALDSLRRARIVLAVLSVLGLVAGILLAVLAWTVPQPLRRPPIDVIPAAPSAVPAKQPELLH